MTDFSTDSQLADLATRQLRDTFALFVKSGGGAIHEGDNVYSYATGLPAFMANGAIVTGPATADELRRALDWVEDSAEMYLVTVDDRFTGPIAAALAERGIGGDDPPAPGMVLDPIGELPDPPADIEIVPADESNYEQWTHIVGEIFLPADVARSIFSVGLMMGPDVRTVLARIDGEYVGAATIVRTGEVAGVYSVGTLESARGRGVGRATTAAVIRAAVDDWGSKQVFLQSSQMGYPVYKALGFRTIAGYQMLGGMRAAR